MHIHLGPTWSMWWRWIVSSTLAAGVAILLYVRLPQALTLPVSEDYDYVAAAWRYLAIYGIVYGVVSTAQWRVLRRHVPDAWRWVLVTTGSAALIYPATMWLFATIGLQGIAEIIWSAGLDYEIGFGGHLFAIAGQWLLLQTWTRHAWVWPLLTPILGIVCILTTAIVSYQVFQGWTLVNMRGTVPFMMLSLFYASSGVIVAGLLGARRLPSTRTTTPKLQVPRT